MRKIVTIGGGTGTFTVLTGLKKLNCDLSAIITVADDGGSTGRLRDEFGFLPAGDFRMALAALADTNGDSNILRELFMYRFSKGIGLQGHNFGNILLTALTDILGEEEKAFEYASKILRIKGRVVPISNETVTLIAHYDDDSMIIGEKNIDEPSKKHDGTKRIKKLMIQPHASISPKAEAEIKNADVIVLGPGDLYTSTIANLIVNGAMEAINSSKAKIVFLVSLINKYGQTYGFTASDYVEELKNYIGKYPDYVLVNSSPLPKEGLVAYAREDSYPVRDDLKKTPYIVKREDLLSDYFISRSEDDKVKRSFIRHHPEKIAHHINKILDIL